MRAISCGAPSYTCYDTCVARECPRGPGRRLRFFDKADTMIEVTILIPVADNSDHLFTAAEFARWEDHLNGLFGGFSHLPGHVAGSWTDNGQRYDDTLRLYVVFIEDITQGGKVGEAVEFAKLAFRQEAITIRYLGLAAIL